MKKYITILLFLCLIGTFAAGCSKNTASTNSDDGKSTGDSKSPVKDDGKTTQSDSKSAIADYIDLTALSSTMIYAEVYNIMTTPDDYMGKTIKMSGPYYASFYEETGLYYHYVIIEDAAACCQSGLEFIWNGEHSYPDDYPKAYIVFTG